MGQNIAMLHCELVSLSLYTYSLSCLLSSPRVFCSPFSTRRGIGEGLHIKAGGVGRRHVVGEEVRVVMDKVGAFL